MNKKAVSPVITTVLLVLIVLILAMLIFLWARGFVGERVSKFDDPIERACESIALDATYTSGRVQVVNEKDIPIYRVGLNIEGGADDEIVYYPKDPDNENIILRGGGVGTYPPVGMDQFNAASGEVIEIIPVILGQNEEGGVEEFACLDYKHTLTV